jgi:hypothetical protein
MNKNKLTFIISALLTSSLLLSGCNSSDETDPMGVDPIVEQNDGSGDGTGDGNANQTDSGQVMLAITDAEEDFLSYTVDIKSIVFTKDNGTQLEVLPTITAVDFVDYQQVTELFSVINVPVGRYDTIDMTLDYSNSSIIIQDEAGTSYDAQAQDADGIALTEYVVKLDLTKSSPLIVSKNRFSHLTLDLDLSASNTVVSYEPAIVQVEPTVIATASINEEREHRLRGVITELNTDDATAPVMTLNIRPMRKKQGDFGKFDLNLSNETSFELNGEVLSLDAAVTALSGMVGSEPVVVFGQVAITQDENGADQINYNATQVLSGSSLPWAGKDGFKGMVTQNTDAGIAISGLGLDSDAPHRQPLRNAPLTVSDNTKIVNRIGIDMGVEFLVPGQRIQAVGQLQGENKDSEFDASGEDAVIRILPSTLRGRVIGYAENGNLVVDAKRINLRPFALIRAAGRPKHTIQIDISELDVIELEEGNWITVAGYINPQGATAHVTAGAIVKHNVMLDTVGYLGYWGEAGATPTIDQDSTSMTLNVAEGRHIMKFPFQPDNVMPEMTSLTVTSSDTARHFIMQNASKENLHFSTYSELLVAMNAAIEAGETVNAMVAKGRLDADLATDSGQTLVVEGLIVKLQ